MTSSPTSPTSPLGAEMVSLADGDLVTVVLEPCLERSDACRGQLS